jgi:hypothetical protein
MCDHATALPDGQCATTPVARECCAHVDSIDADEEVVPGHRLPGKCEDALDEGNTERQLCAFGEKGRERFGRHGDVEIRDGKRASRLVRNERTNKAWNPSGPNTETFLK